MKFNSSSIMAALAALMVIPLVSAITPEGMLSAPRRSGAIPSPDGALAVFTETTYSFETEKAHTVWNWLNLTSGETSLLYNGSDIAEIVFVGQDPTSIIYVNGTNEEGDGGVSMYSADILSIDNSTLVASLPAPYSGMKASVTQSGDIHFLVNCLAYPNGTAYNPDLAVEAPSTARIYTQIYVRHWDTYLIPQKYAVFGGVLTFSGGSYSLAGNLTNYVTSIKNVTQAESPVQPFGDSGDYDILPDGSQVAFLTKNIDLPLANYTSSIIYLVAFNGTAKDAVPINAFAGTTTPPNARGASAAPRFSPDGLMIVYMQMNGISYESDRNIIYVANTATTNFNITSLATNWDRSPDAVQWGRNNSMVYVAAPDLGRERIFPVPLSAQSTYVPTNITNEGVPAAFYVLPNNDILVSDSKIWSSRDIYTVSPSGGVVKTYLQANLIDEALAGLGPEDVSEFYFSTNTTTIDLQSWIIYPEGFNPNKTYPLAFIVHGGPQGAHFNSWSTRWNFKVWADQGYVVVAPNPTASSGWGQNLTDSIAGRWGSYPYWDLVNCFNHVNQTFDYIDTEHAIEAGASFGGYMTNWIQGHPMGRWFKALVTHDGSTNTYSQYTSEELWFMNHDFNGTFIDNRVAYNEWNPVNYVNEWATPHFVVHNDLDYRLPIAEGIMLFNLLQVKGVPSKFLNFPDENHWVLNRQNSLVWHTEIFKWINYYSGISNATSPY